jgi:hypothetical protein
MNKRYLKAIINKKLAALNLSGYNAQMIMNRAEAMSCSESKSPHAVIEPSALRATKAVQFE